MPPESTRNVVARLAAVLARTPPEQALSEMLAAARTFGIVPISEADGPRFLTLSHDARTLALGLRPDASLDDQSATPIADLLRVAFARAAEHEQLQRVRERMELLSAASFEGLFFHVDGVIVDANQRVSELLGYPVAELLGRETLRRCVAPEDLPEVLKRMASGSEGEYVITGIRKDGSRFRAEVQAKQGKLDNRPVRVVAVRDVTARERTQALLRENEERLRSLVETAFDITVFSRDGVVVDIVGDLGRVLGYGLQDVVGRPILEFIPKAVAPRVRTILDEGRPGVYRSMVIAATGEEVPLEVVAVHTTLNGQPVRMAAMRDLRETERLERERRDLELMLERSQRLESLGVLAGGIAHDFNNLLTVVLGNAELLRMRVQGGADRALVQDIIEAAQRAANLTTQMLAYAGRGELGPRTAIDLGVLLRELHALLDATLSKKAQVLVDVADDSVVLGNRATLTQVLMNLLTNASDALAGNPGTIHVHTRHVREPDARFVRALGAKAGPGRWVLLEISDTGSGMDAATQARVFEPFFTTKSQGHGLGLAATVGIVSSHGGAILVESESGRGSTFSVLLPAFEGQSPAEPRSPQPAELATTRTVLVVDDEPLVRSNLRSLLEAYGYRVREAGNGTAALEAIAVEEPSVVLLDMTMPDLNGIEVLRRIRQRGCRVPVILSSGYHDATFELEPDTYQGFLVKPYTIAELLDAVGIEAPPRSAGAVPPEAPPRSAGAVPPEAPPRSAGAVPPKPNAQR